MKKLLVFVSLLFFLVFSSNFLVNAFALELNPQTKIEKSSLETVNNSVVGERIEDFTSNIHINKDGSIEVKETIKYFFDSYRHGIFRNIPFTKSDNGKRYDLEFNFKSVTDENGNNYQVSTSKQGTQWVLKIGDPSRTITGEHTYIIAYKVKGALGYFKDHDELFWNITGNGWDVPIQKADTIITLPEKFSDAQIKLACFTGDYNSKKQNCTGNTDGEKTTIQTTLFLNSNEGLTIVEGFPKNIVAVLKPTEYVPFFDRWYGKIVLVLIVLTAFCWYIILPIWLVIHWYRTGRDPDVGRPVTAGFDPPEARLAKGGPPKAGKPASPNASLGGRFLTPAETGTLIDETVQQRDIFASIVDLARRGYLRIEEREKKDSYLIYLNKPKQKDKLQPFEKELLTGIFAGKTEIRLKDTQMYTTINKVSDMLYKDMVQNGYFKTNPKTTRTLYYVLGAISLFTLNLILAFVSFLFGKNMPKKTLFGAKQASVAKGLKNFLTSQERQLEFQADKQMMFEKLLPFAVAFGVEKIWAKRFEKFKLKQPDWYQGYGSSTFNSYLFVSALSNSYRSFAVSSTPPSSSGSGFSGGSSGGGGGGGGGGSW